MSLCDISLTLAAIHKRVVGHTPRWPASDLRFKVAVEQSSVVSVLYCHVPKLHLFIILCACVLVALPVVIIPAVVFEGTKSVK